MIIIFISYLKNINTSQREIRLVCARNQVVEEPDKQKKTSKIDVIKTFSNYVRYRK